MVSVVYTQSQAILDYSKFVPTDMLSKLTAVGVNIKPNIGFKVPIFFTADYQILWSATLYVYEKGQISRSRSNETLRTYTEHLVSWLKFLEKQVISVENATEETLVNFRNDMKQTRSSRTGNFYSNRTINSRVSGVKRFYRWANKKKHFESLIDDFVSTSGFMDFPSKNTGEQNGSFNNLMLRVQERFPRIVKVSEFQKLCSFVSEDEKLAYRWLLSTGLRRFEACSLTISHIPDVTHVDPSNTPLLEIDLFRKGGKQSIVWAPFLLVEETNWYITLNRLPKIRELPINELNLQPLFVNSLGRRYSPDHFGKRLREASFLAGIDCRPHDLRHTFAVCALKVLQDMANKGRLINPLKVLQLLLGHSSIESVGIYLRALETGSEAVVEVLDYLYGAAINQITFGN